MIYGRVILKNSRYKPITQAGDDQVFSAPWHCELFALTIFLHEKKVFDWEHWTNQLGYKLKNKPVGTADDLDYYYNSWLETLEELVLQKEVVCLGDIQKEASNLMKHLHDGDH